MWGIPSRQSNCLLSDPKGCYPVLFRHADIPDEAVYKITRTIFENLAALHEIHKATREVTLDNALTGLGAPLHPGAARYYREQGIEIPARLVPP